MDNKRYRVTYNLVYPFVVIDGRQSYDSLLAWSLVDMLQKNGEEITDYAEVIDGLPIKKVPYNDTYFYTASSPIMDTIVTHKATISKLTTISRYERYMSAKDMLTLMGKGDKKLSKCVLDQGRTVYKQFSVSMDVLPVKKIAYVADVTDFEMFKMLAENIEYIGKKKALGYGRVANVSICPTDEVISRIAPIDTGYEYEYPVFASTIKPPYWEKGNRYICGTIKF
jgi:CRISPR type IV-associated protein Csf3